MGVLGRRAPAAGTPEPSRPQMRVLRADGRRIDLTSRDSAKYLIATRQAWAAEAWAYRDLIGELRYAQRLLARSVSRVRFYVAEQRSFPLDPAALDTENPEHDLDKQLAADAITNFNRLPLDENPDGFTARLVENLSTPGEAWVHIDADDQFWVRSTSEVTASQSGQVVVIATLPKATAANQRLLDPNTEELLRLWIGHPEYADLADSPMRALLDVAEDVVLAGREARSAARSRVAANGFLLVPDSMDLLRERDDDTDDDETGPSFQADLTAAMLAPLEQDGDAQGVVPILLRGAAEDLKEVRHLTVSRADSEQLIARQGAAIMRLLRGLDVQPEQVDGMGQSNHWSAWLITAQSINDQIRPMAETIAACLVQAFLHPALESLGYSKTDVKRVTIAVDVTPLAENPNRAQDARDAHDREAISDSALREALGFDDDDAPDGLELIRRALSQGRITPLAIPLIVEALAGRMPDQEDIDRAVGQVPPPDGQTAKPAVDSSRPAVTQGEVVPSTPTPAEPTSTTGPVTASAAPKIALHVDLDASRKLADIDALLAERITVAADAALSRVLEKAGAKVRSAAQKDKAVVASLAAVDVTRIPSVLGRDRVESFVPVRDLLSDSYSRLHSQVDDWFRQAAEQAGDAVVAILGLGGEAAALARKTVVTRLANSADRAWPILADALDEAAEHYLFEPDDDGPLLAAQDVVDALAAAGGDDLASLTAAGHQQRRKRRPVKRKPRSQPGSGFATGPVVTQAIASHGGILLGHEWRYRPERHRATAEFMPHKHLDGIRFSTWQDPQLDTTGAGEWVGPFFHPGDHRGCACGAAPVYALVSDQDSEPAKLLRDAGGDPLKVRGATVKDLKDRINAAVDDMRRDVITKPRRRR